jgi:hypothetical protein
MPLIALAKETTARVFKLVQSNFGFGVFVSSGDAASVSIVTSSFFFSAMIVLLSRNGITMAGAPAD